MYFLEEMTLFFYALYLTYFARIPLVLLFESTALLNFNDSKY